MFIGGTTYINQIAVLFGRFQINQEVPSGSMVASILIGFSLMGEIIIRTSTCAGRVQ